MNVKIALPAKGRLHEPTLQLLSKTGLMLLERDVRALFAKTNDPEVSVIFVRAPDIPRFVESGAADLGVTGCDYVDESGAEVKELLDLEYGEARIVLAAPEGGNVRSPSDITDETRIATKLPNLTKAYLRAHNRNAKVVQISGAAEIMPYIGVSDLIVDTMNTGATLRTHGLRVVGEILRSTSRLIGNKQALDDKEAKLRQILLAFKSVVMANRKKLIMMNVPEECLEAVVKAIPSMSGPTVARVQSEVPMWEVYSVIDERGVYETINQAKQAGARDILVMPIERVIP